MSDRIQFYVAPGNTDETHAGAITAGRVVVSVWFSGAMGSWAVRRCLGDMDQTFYCRSRDAAATLAAELLDSAIMGQERGAL